ncbi:probable carboxylesterase 2 [Impatiens glandulifera]|uniref:probable carboxylesterase 2 n=1 Tax=Impatiens glandulifera TaxID=253017 RepID=UPI001FB0CACC|nr:probable carboxylesterase 2 [Impatiens glandulifera]
MSVESTTGGEIVHAIWDILRIHKDGSVVRLMGCEVAPASIDPQTGVQSKDVVISPETAISVRLYLPKSALNPSTHKLKLPLLVYFHGGGFCIATASFPPYHNFLNSLVAAANIVAISVDYRRAPEHPLPTAFEDSWEAVKWVISAGDEWVKNLADLERLFFAGDSAGGNIAYRMSIRVGLEMEWLSSSGAKLVGIVLVHPLFGGEESIGSELEVNAAVKSDYDNLWRIVWPSVKSLDDPIINPSMDPNIARMGCERVLVCVAEKDGLRDRGWCFYDAVKRSVWKGTVEIVKTAGEDHVFHLFNPTGDNALAFIKMLVSFFNEEIRN